MNDGLRAELATAKDAALTDFVIEWAGEPVKSIKTGFNAAVKAANLKSVSPHVLRHTAAVMKMEAGLDLEEIQRFLEHTDARTTSIYVRRIRGDADKGWEKVEKKLRKIRRVRQKLHLDATAPEGSTPCSRKPRPPVTP